MHRMIRYHPEYHSTAGVSEYLAEPENWEDEDASACP